MTDDHVEMMRDERMNKIFRTKDSRYAAEWWRWWRSDREA